VSTLNDLLYQLRAKEPELAKDLEREVTALTERRAFGLNFERHVPEAVELPGRKVRKGDKVRVLPPRGQMPTKSDETLWRVLAINRIAAVASLELLDTSAYDGEVSSAVTEVALEDLVVVAEFRDPIYPGLVSTGKVMRGGDKPFHTVINAENFHALETLLFTCRGKVDAIYIDPPYNTGARDWKYNNDYVEGDDLYRHSKWLAFMERRLLLAKELLNPEDSVLVVTIDEKEYLRLGMLLEQVFPEASAQMVTIVINPNGVARGREMARVEEYAFFMFFGHSAPALVADSLLDTENVSGVRRSGVRWEWLMRGGSNSRRVDRPNLFYPIFIDPESRTVSDVGQPLPLSASIDIVAKRPGLVTVWPIRTSGEEANWRTSAEYLRDLLAAGYARVGAFDARNDRWALLYLGKAQIRRIETGEIQVVGRRQDGSVELAGDTEQKRTPKTVWNRPSHKAGEYGSTLLKRFIGARPFPFPKSLYAVEDTLRILVGNNPTALVVDFFAGSGTTAHALMRLNKQDGGRRRSVSVTNNEVAADEQRSLRDARLRPGDAEWERWGICEYVAKPRIEAAITGRAPDHEPIKGDYKFIDEFPMADGFEENVEFFALTYEAPLRVSSNREFATIAPLLWLRAGACGRRIEDISGGWDVVDAYGVLADLDQSEAFLKAIAAMGDQITTAFIVTDEDRLFESVARELPERVEPVRLYEAYLRNFEIESGRGAL